MALARELRLLARQAIVTELQKVIVGQDEQVEQVLTTQTRVLPDTVQSSDLRQCQRIPELPEQFSPQSDNG